MGDKIATLVSLSLTPLRIDKIKEIRADVDQVDIDGKAILFESGIYAKIPADLPEKLALSALDVAGAPAQTAKLVKPGDTVLIIGAGPTGICTLLCARLKHPKRIIVCEQSPERRRFVREHYPEVLTIAPEAVARRFLRTAIAAAPTSCWRWPARKIRSVWRGSAPDPTRWLPS